MIRLPRVPSNYSGVVLPVFYVRDILASVRFYKNVCGFSVISFLDAEAAEEVNVWEKSEPRLFVRMCAASQESALHLNRGEFSSMDGMKRYFEVNDVDRQHREIEERGGSPTEIASLPWMRVFSVADPDRHILYFQTPNSKWEKGGRG